MSFVRPEQRHGILLQNLPICSSWRITWGTQFAPAVIGGRQSALLCSSWRIRGAADGGREGGGLDNVGNRGGNSPADCREMTETFWRFEEKNLSKIFKVHTGGLSLYCHMCVATFKVWPPSVGFVRTWRTGAYSLISGNKVGAQTMEHIHQHGNSVLCLMRSSVWSNSMCNTIFDPKQLKRTFK